MKSNVFLFSLIIPLILIYNAFAVNNSRFVYDKKGKITDLDEISENKEAILLFYSDYNCINCINSLKKCLKLISDSNNVNIFIISRIGSKFDDLKAIYEVTRIKKIFKNYPIYFDIHESDDVGPPTNLKDGLFGRYKLNNFPSLLVFNKDKEVLLTYEELFPDNYTVETLYKKILSALKKTSK